MVSTAALECLHQQCPGQFLTDVFGTDVDAIFQNNPHVTKLPDDTEGIFMHNPLINLCDHRPVHFLDSYIKTLSDNLKIDLKLTLNRPVLYLSDEEKGWMSQVEELTGVKKYWVVSASWKNDYTVKHAGSDLYQEVIKRLKGKIQFVQVGLPHHNYKVLDGAINLIGKTDTRQLIRLVWNAQGGLGGESFCGHLFAAFDKPFVALLSGFLPAHWVQYPSSTIITKQQMMSCAGSRGCWKSRVKTLGDGDNKDNSLCAFPMVADDEVVPKCMAMITPEEVVAAVEGYYEGSRLAF